MRAALEARGVPELYAHQLEAWEAAVRGEHVAVVTGTASGKSLAFNLPVLDALAREPKKRAIYLYPTKALAQDQLRSLTDLKVPRVRAAIYDGDTEAERRWQIRKWSNLVLSNPDMLHVGVLPHHDRWGDVLSNLAYVVVDEAHVYRGVFGSHVGNVLRRLRRMARVYGADPQFLLASATISNPGGAGALAARPGRDRGRRRRGPACRADDRALEPGAAGRGARHPRQCARGGVAADGRARLARPAHALLREEPKVGGADPQVHGRPARRRVPGPALALPGRVHARPAPRHRAAPRGRRAARRVGDRCARARHRHRAARLRDLDRLPGHRREPPAAVGPRRTAGARPGDPGRVGGRARPVLHARAGDAARPARRGGDPRPHEPAGARRARPRGRVRGADRRRRPRRARRRGAGAGGAPPRAAARRPAGFVWAGRDYPAARVPLRSTSPDSFSVDRHRRRLGARPGRARARVLDRARGRRLPPPGRGRTASRRSTSTRDRRWSRRSTATSTPR